MLHSSTRGVLGLVTGLGALGCNFLPTSLYNNNVGIDAGALPNADVVRYASCPPKVVGVKYDETLMGAAPDLIESGENDIPLSPPLAGSDSDPVSCVHLRIKRDSKGEIVARRIVVLSPSKNFTTLSELVLFKLETSNSGSIASNDDNLDGFFERVEETSVDGDGAWTKTVTTLYISEDDGPSRRLVSEPFDADTASLTEESWDGTGWQPLSEETVSRTQRKCVTPDDLEEPTGGGGTCEPVTCTKAQRQTILDGMKAALLKSENCAPARVTSKPAAELASGLIEPACMKGSGCGYGETIPDGTPTKDKKRVVTVNVDHLNDAQFMPTVFHELVHIGLGSEGKHKETQQQLAALLGKGLLVDRTYACEITCFAPPGTPATKCDCAVCIDTVTQDDGTPRRATVCDSICSNFDDCTAQDPATETGSYCARSRTFCDTVGECRAACVTGADACGKKDPDTGDYEREGGNLSRSCDPACN